MNADLFGNVPTPRIGALSDVERKRAQRRLAERPRGYAAPPGSGPAGETCRTCGHATDIRIRSPACSRWEAPPAPTGDKPT